MLLLDQDHWSVVGAEDVHEASWRCRVDMFDVVAVAVAVVVAVDVVEDVAESFRKRAALVRR